MPTIIVTTSVSIVRGIVIFIDSLDMGFVFKKCPGSLSQHGAIGYTVYPLIGLWFVAGTGLEPVSSGYEPGVFPIELTRDI